MLLEFYLENYFGGWRNVPVVKNTGYFSKGPLFNYHQPHSGLKPPVTPAPEGLMPSFASLNKSLAHGAQMNLKTDIHTHKISIF